jgi:DNA-binding MarR family transcriptional regulator
MRLSSTTRSRSEMIHAMADAGRDLSTATLMFHQAIADRLGLNPTDHKCMGIIARNIPITAGRLAELTGLTSGAITGVVDRLVKAGFVRREADPSDRRRVLIAPVDDPAKLRTMLRLFDGVARASRALAASYSDRDLALVLDFMARSREMLDAEMRKLRDGEPATARRPKRTRRPAAPRTGRQ